jgi:hypothetical protein
MKDGTTMTCPPINDPNIDYPLGELDQRVHVLRFDQENGQSIVVMNYGVHADTVNGDRICSDWPGWTRRTLDKALDGVKAILVNGFQGDSNHINPFRAKELEQKRRGVAHSSFMGKTISDVVVSLWDKTEPLEPGRIWGKVELLFVPTNRAGSDRIEECKQTLRDVAEGKREPLKTSTIISETNRIASLPDELLFQRVPVSALCIGPAGFIGFGGEPFTKYIQMVREKGGEMFMMTACQANGGQGYLPTAGAYAQGGYEARSSRFDPVLEKMLTECTEKLLNEYKSF